MSLDPQNLSLIALRMELKKRDLSIAGTKEELVARLTAALPPSTSTPAVTPPTTSASGAPPTSTPAAPPPSTPAAASSSTPAVASSSTPAVPTPSAAAADHPSDPGHFAVSHPSNPLLSPAKPSASSDSRAKEESKDEKKETAADSQGSDSEGHKKMLKDNPDKIHSGVCRWYKPSRGYGFITPSEGDPSDLFVHQSEIYSNEYRALEPGEPVEFKLALATNGKVVAVSVTGPGGQPVRSGSRPPDYYHQFPDPDEERWRRDEYLYGRRRRRDSYDEYYGYPRGSGYRTIQVSEGGRLEPPRPMTEEEKENYKKQGPNMTEADDRPICKGTVKSFDAKQGFGFIIPDDDKTQDIYVHESQIHASGQRLLVEGESVEYRLGDGEKGKVAQKVTGPNGAVVSSNEPIQFFPSERKGRDKGRRFGRFGNRRRREEKASKDAPEAKERSKTYYCAICNVSLSGDQPLADHNKGKRHMRLSMAAQQTGGEIYRCLDCNKSFSSRVDMARHMEGKHPGVTAQEIVSSVGDTTTSTTTPGDPSKPTVVPSVGFTAIASTTQAAVGPQTRQAESSSKKKKKKKKQRLGSGSMVNFIPASGENGSTGSTPMKTDATETSIATSTATGVDSSPLKPEEMKCELCNVPFTGRQQRDQHLKGRKHQLKASGGPPPTPGYGYRGKRKYGAPAPAPPSSTQGAYNPYPHGAYNPYPSHYYKPYPAPYYNPYPSHSSAPQSSAPPAGAPGPAGSVPSTINYPYPPYSNYPPQSYSPYPSSGGSAPPS